MRAAILLLLVTACAQAAVLQRAVDDKRPDFRKLPQRHLPYAGLGSCGERVYDPSTDLTSVSCLGAKIPLSPGQTIDTMMTLASPYPEEGLYLVVNQTSQMVDETGRAVPLSEVYLHHWGGPATFVQGSGAEIRTSYVRKPLPAPYGTVVNGSFYKSPLTRLANIQLINTIGLPKEDAKSCLECWCDHDPWHPKGTIDNGLTVPGRPHPDRGDPTGNHTKPEQLAGSLLCCHQCPSDNPYQEPIGYHVQYNITYRSLKAGEKIEPVGSMIYDVVGGSFEYQISEPTGPGTTHTLTLDTTADASCPQDKPFKIVRCTGHQHFGGQCLSLYNLDKNNELICQTCPEFGTQPGVPGDEEGYVVRIPDDDPATPYEIAPGTNVRIESKYDYSIPRFGIMGLFFTTASDLTRVCGPFGNRSNSNSNDIGPYGVHTSMGGHMDDGVMLYLE